jgi:hypothetical protein
VVLLRGGVGSRLVVSEADQTDGLKPGSGSARWVAGPRLELTADSGKATVGASAVAGGGKATVSAWVAVFGQATLGRAVVGRATVRSSASEAAAGWSSGLSNQLVTGAAAEGGADEVGGVGGTGGVRGIGGIGGVRGIGGVGGMMVGGTAIRGVEACSLAGVVVSGSSAGGVGVTAEVGDKAGRKLSGGSHGSSSRC